MGRWMQVSTEADKETIEWQTPTWGEYKSVTAFTTDGTKTYNTSILRATPEQIFFLLTELNFKIMLWPKINKEKLI